LFVKDPNKLEALVAKEGDCDETFAGVDAVGELVVVVVDVAGGGAIGVVGGVGGLGAIGLVDGEEVVVVVVGLVAIGLGAIGLFVGEEVVVVVFPGTVGVVIPSK